MKLVKGKEVSNFKSQIINLGAFSKVPISIFLKIIMSYLCISKLILHQSFDLLAQAFVVHSFWIATATDLNTKIYNWKREYWTKAHSSFLYYSIAQLLAI